MAKSKRKPGPRRKEVVILGMHRSGTSCVGNVLTGLGVYFGDDSVSTGANEENPKGFFERRDIRDICDLILQGSGCDWWAVSDFSADTVPPHVRRDANERFTAVLQDLEAHRPWFIKEPRLCFVLPVLRAQLTNPIVVHVWRHPVEVARSLAARNGFPMDFGIALWEAYVRAAHFASRDYPSVVVSYNAMVNAPAKEVKRLLTALQELGVDGLLMPSKQKLRDAVDTMLYRNRLATSRRDDFLASSQRQLLSALAQGNTSNSELFKPLPKSSRIRLDNWIRRKGIVFALQSKVSESSRARVQLMKLRSEVASQKQRIDTLEGEMASREIPKEEGLKRLTAGLRAITVVADDKAAAIDQLNAELQRRNKIAEEGRRAANAVPQQQAQQLDSIRAELEAARDMVSERESQLENVHAQIKRREKQFEMLESQLQASRDLVSDRKAQLEQLREEVKEAEDQIASLQSELQYLRNNLAEREIQLKELRDKVKQREEQIEGLKSDSHATRNAMLERDIQADQLRAELRTVGERLQEIRSEAARLHEDVRRREHYVKYVKSHLKTLRNTVEREVARILEENSVNGAIEAAQAAARLRFCGSSTLDILSGHESGKHQRRFERGLLLLHARYRLLCGRQDAETLVRIAASGLFDPRYYLEQYQDVAASGWDPLMHFVDFGASEGRNPSPLFDTAYYLRSNPDVAEEGVNPLLHFILHGRNEGRLPKSLGAERVQIGNWTLPPLPATHDAHVPPSPRPERVVIYTAVTGGYDDLKTPILRLGNCHFVVFSDQELQVEGWEVRPFNYFHEDPVRAARFVKLHPHIYFPDYDCSIWLDANIGIRGDVRAFFEYLDNKSPIGMFVHPFRDCIFVEGVECIKRRKDAPETIDRQLERYRAEGFTENMGLWETGVLVRHHNDLVCISLMTEWWREIEVGSRRDQISLPVAARRLGVKISPLGSPSTDLRHHELLAFVKHPERARSPAKKAPPRPATRNNDIASISVDIGVCVYNSLAETRACLISLIAARRPQDRIIIIDDASDVPTATFLEQFAADHSGITLVRHDQNRGYTVSANTFFAEALGDWVFLVNSDTIVPSRALTKLVACGQQFPRLGVLGPLSNAASWQTVPTLIGDDGKFAVNKIPNSFSVEDLDRICEDVSAGGVLFVPLVNGFCLGIRRALVERLGGFDEASFPRGYGEEDDFCLRAGAEGFLCGIVLDTYVYHSKSASFSTEGRAPLAASGGKALRSKHSAERISAAVEMLRNHPELRRVRDRIAKRLCVAHPETNVEPT